MIPLVADPTQDLISDPIETPHLFISTLYQTNRCHERALWEYHTIFARLKGEYEFTTSIWKFDHLEFPNMRKLAVADAIEADIIIVSAEDIQEVSNGVESWLSEWSAHPRVRPAAIVGLFMTNGGYLENRLETRLELISEAHGLAFFSKTLEEPPDSSGE